jgi:hypothetical protein
MNDPLAKLGWTVDWGFLESFGEVYNDGPGQPPRQAHRGDPILKHMHDLRRGLCERWIKNLRSTVLRQGLLPT